jgi:glycosyltransferase involved in cell wall biosynthesis
MSRRLKVLMSAYACEPNKGSEPEVGWQWALQMARFHDVTVLTRENNRASIESELIKLQGKQPLPRFIYHERPKPVLELKRRFHSVKAYYLLWQHSARDVIAILQAEHHFDLLHHVTFAGFRYPTAVWGHGVPTLWGPVGGIESVQPSLLPWGHLPSLLMESLRGLNNLVQAAPFQMLSRRSQATTLILASTPEMQQTFQRLGFEAQLMPTVGLMVRDLPFRPHEVSRGPLRLLFVGNIITLKGVDLALQALKASGTNATLTLFGTGNYQAAAGRLAHRLGLAERVFFKGRLPRLELLKIYSDYDLFVFPSLHDTGGYALIEAMLNELPAICLDCGGPAVAVAPGCGIKVPLGQRSRVIAGLAEALRQYDADRTLVASHGKAARQFILNKYDWDTKGLEMDAVYSETVERAAARHPGVRDSNYSGMGNVSNTLNRAVSFKGIVVAFVLLLLVGLLGFASISLLKQEVRKIANASLPAMHNIASANASMDQGFKYTLTHLLSTSAVERALLRENITQANRTTTEYLTDYGAGITDATERKGFESMKNHREAYVAIRDQMTGLAEAGDQAEAIVVCQNKLLPAFNLYKQEAERLQEGQIAQSKVRSEWIVTLCTITQAVVATVAILLFVVGFLLGFFK